MHKNIKIILVIAIITFSILAMLVIHCLKVIYLQFIFIGAADYASYFSY